MHEMKSFSDMQNVNGMPGNRGQLDKTNTSEDLDNDFMNELNQFEFEINNERQRRHSQQRIQYNGEQSLNANARSNGAAPPGKKVMRKKRHTKQRTDNDSGQKSHYRSSAKAVKLKQDQDQMDEYSSSPYSSEDERYSSGPESPGYDDEYQSTEPDTPFQSKQQKSQTQQQQYEANSKNGHFVEATNLLSDSEQYTQQNQQQYYAINEQFDEGISNDGGRIVSDIDINLDAPNQSKYDDEKDGVQNVSTDIGSPSTDQTTFHKEQSLTSEMSTDLIDDGSMAREPNKSAESGSSETSTFKSRMNKVLSHESSQDSTNGGLGSSKWKLLKTLKEKRIEEKNNQEKIKEEENANKDKSSVSRGVTITTLILHFSMFIFLSLKRFSVSISNSFSYTFIATKFSISPNL